MRGERTARVPTPVRPPTRRVWAARVVGGGRRAGCRVRAGDLVEHTAQERPGVVGLAERIEMRLARRQRSRMLRPSRSTWSSSDEPVASVSDSTVRQRVVERVDGSERLVGVPGPALGRRGTERFLTTTITATTATMTTTTMPATIHISVPHAIGQREGVMAVTNSGPWPRQPPRPRTRSRRASRPTRSRPSPRRTRSPARRTRGRWPRSAPARRAA